MSFCLLAALFAVEAKLAWYGPDSSLTSQISASKLQPTEAPRVLAEALSFSAAVLFIASVSLVSFALQFSALFKRSVDLGSMRQVPIGFSPQVFLRPPPSL